MLFSIVAIFSCLSLSSGTYSTSIFVGRVLFRWCDFLLIADTTFAEMD